MSSKKNGFHSDLEANTKQKPYRSANHKHKSSKQKGPYLLGETIGEGAFAKVKVAVHIQTNEKVAIKILDKEKTFQEEEDVNRVQKEIDILKKLKHKNIIQLYEIMESKKNLYIVMEYCEGKELFEYIVKKKKLGELEACKFFQEIIDALEYLHENNITHRDLKPENLLLDYKKCIKLSDFGLSTIKSSERSLLGTPCGTPNYAPPEMLRGDEYNGLLSDVWSCGIILYAMLCGYLPFSESKEQIIYQKIIDHEYEYPSFLSSSAVDLLQNILKVEPAERFDIKRIKRHPWFNLTQPVLRPGLIIGKICIPIDNGILKKVENLGFDKEKCRQNLLNNKFDSLTTIYYLCLRKFIKEGGKSISDLNSGEYLNYIKKQLTLMSFSNEENKCELNGKAMNNKSLDKLNNADLSIDDIKRYQNRDVEENKNCFENREISRENNKSMGSREATDQDLDISNPQNDSNKLNETVVRLNNDSSEAKLNKFPLDKPQLASGLKENSNNNLKNETKNNLTNNNNNVLSLNKLQINTSKDRSTKQKESKDDTSKKRNSHFINKSLHHEIFNDRSNKSINNRNETFNRTNSQVNESLCNNRSNKQEDNYEKIIDIIAKINQKKNCVLNAPTEESKILPDKSLINDSLSFRKNEYHIRQKLKSPSNNSFTNKGGEEIDNKKNYVIRREFNSDKKGYSNRIYMPNELNSFSEKTLTTERISLSNKNNNENSFDLRSDKNIQESPYLQSNDKANFTDEKFGEEEEGEAIITEINQRLSMTNDCFSEENNSNINSNPHFEINDKIKHEISTPSKNSKLNKEKEEQDSFKQKIKTNSSKFATTDRNKPIDNRTLNKAHPTPNNKKTNEKYSSVKTVNENLIKNNASKNQSINKSVFKDKNNKQIERIISHLNKNTNLITPKNPSFISQNEYQSESKNNKITEKIIAEKYRNSICIPDPNFSDKLSNFINAKDAAGNSHTIREKLREYSSSFMDQAYKSNLNPLKEPTNQATSLKYSNNSKEKLKNKNKNESLTSSIFSKGKENILKEHIKDREKEIRQNRINQQKNKVASTTKNAAAPHNYAINNNKNKNIFSPLNKDIKKVKDNDIINGAVEKVEINLDKKKQLNINVKSPCYLDSRSVNSEEKAKYNFNKNSNKNTSPEAFKSHVPAKSINNKDSISKGKNPEIRNNLSLKTDRYIYSSFLSGRNTELNKNEKMLISPKSNETRSKIATKNKTGFDKNNYLTNKVAAAAGNTKTQDIEHKELNEYIDNKPTESNVDFEIEEYEELTRINPNMKVLEFIANKLVEKSKHLDNNLLDGKQKSNSTINNTSKHLSNVNNSNQASKAGSQSRKCSMESNNTFVVKNNENEFDQVINVLNNKYKNLIVLNRANKVNNISNPQNNFDFSSDEKISLLLNKETENSNFKVKNENKNNKLINLFRDNYLEKTLTNSFVNITNSGEKAFPEPQRNNTKNNTDTLVNQQKRVEYSKTFIEKAPDESKWTNSLANRDKKTSDTNNNNNKLLRKMPSKSKMNVNRKLNSRNRFKSNGDSSKNKNLRFNRDKKFNRENLLINLSIAKQIFSKEKKPLGLNLQKTFEDESNKKPNSNNENQIKAIKDSINKVNITNNIFNKNAVLDISATYDPELDSRGETSVERSKSKPAARRSFSIGNKNESLFATSPKGNNNNNNLISINENYKDEVNESFNIKKISFKDEKKAGNMIDKDMNIKIFENSSEVISNLKTNLWEEDRQEVKNKQASDINKNFNADLDSKNNFVYDNHNNKGLSGLISETDEEGTHKLSFNNLNQNLKTPLKDIEIAKKLNANKAQNKMSLNNSNKEAMISNKNKNSAINNYLTEKRVVTINLTDLPNNNLIENSKKKILTNNEANNHQGNLNLNKNKKNNRLISNLTERIPSIDLGNPLRTNTNNVNLNKLLSNSKNNDKRIANVNPYLQIISTPNANFNKGNLNKNFNNEVKENNFNHKESIKENLILETCIESNLKPSIEKSLNHKKELLIIDNSNNLDAGDVKNLAANFPNNIDIVSSGVQSININNIHIKNFNVNADSNFCELLNLGKYRNIGNQDNEAQYESLSNHLNNQIYLNTDTNYESSKPDLPEKDITKPYIQVRKYSEKNLIEKDSNNNDTQNKKINNTKDDCKTNKALNNIDSNNDYNDKINNKYLQENILKIKKNIVNRGHIKTNSAFEFDVNKLNLQNLINPNFYLKENLNKELKISETFKKAENGNSVNNQNHLVKDEKEIKNNLNSLITNTHRRNQSYFNSSSNKKLNKFTTNLHKKAVNSVNFERKNDPENYKNYFVTPPLTTKNMGYTPKNIVGNEAGQNVKNIFINTNSEFNITEKLDKDNKDEDNNQFIISGFSKSTKNKKTIDKHARKQIKINEKTNYKSLIKEFREGLMRKHSNSLSNLHDFLKGNMVKFDTSNKQKANKKNKNSNKNSTNTKNSNSNNFNSNDKNIIIENIEMEIDLDAGHRENLNQIIFENKNKRSKNKINNKSLSFGDLGTLFNKKKLNSVNAKNLFSPHAEGYKNSNQQPHVNSDKAVNSLKSNGSLGSQKSLLDNDAKYSGSGKALSNFNNNILKSTLKDFKNKQTGLKKDLYDLVKNGYKNLFSNNEKNKVSGSVFKEKEDESNRQINTTRNNFDMKIEFGQESIKNLFQASHNQILFSETTKNVNSFNSNMGIPKQPLDSNKNKDLIESKNYNHSSANLLNKQVPSGEKHSDNFNNFAKTGNNFFSSNKNNNLKINTNYNTNNSEFSLTINNFYNFKNSALLTNRNEKVKVFELLDKENEKLKTYEGPVDINFLSLNEPRSIITDCINTLSAKKITYVQTTPYKLRCTKNGLAFNIEVFKIDEKNNLFYVKIKQMQGEKDHYRKILHNFISKEN